MITYHADHKIFNLSTKNTSYVFGEADGRLFHLHWGKKFDNPFNFMSYLADYQYAAFCANTEEGYCLEPMPLEFSTFGNPDLRQPSLHIRYENGSTDSVFKYESHRIFDGKPGLKGLPATYVEDDSEAQTLEIKLTDEMTNISVYLLYSVYPELDVITRSMRVENNGKETVKILRAMSATMDFVEDGYELIHLHGNHMMERQVDRVKVTKADVSIGSVRGASSHRHNPFMALVKPETTETQGDAYGFNFVYSGNFLAGVSPNIYRGFRAQMGIHPFNSGWVLEPGADFQAPEVVLTYSPSGLGQMSRNFHKLYRTRMCRGKFRDTERPILINNWEATYFGFNEEKLLAMAEKASKAGIELFVMDDGWFGKRDDDKSSLGDWTVDLNKLPHGLDHLGKELNKLGMKFGIWFEPEMISEVSNLYEAHPDWALQVPGRYKNMGRTQYILDLSRQDVCDYIVDAINNVIGSANIEYVKWDFNRNMTNVWSALLDSEKQTEVYHRYMLGLYDVLERITSANPDVLFESCSGGGGRFDPGMLYYMPQVWTSDNTCAIDRQKIQYGTSFAYPVVTMGAHVSDVPNGTVKTTPLQTRAFLAMNGTYGYEFDITKFDDDYLGRLKMYNEMFKKLRHTIHTGDFYRLYSPFETDFASWQYISEDKEQAILFVFANATSHARHTYFIRALDLDPDAIYVEDGTGKEYTGDYLMNIGHMLTSTQEYGNACWVYNKKH
ncbi:MAG: alpha-galactosidase [Clostridia bacterium]|nr:alpha-galactosidase [Clostridia bacterium]